eukprot:Seg9358.2 transcript_id=Seg9358.2/GoldUCD/mRNA.D3Y31 product="hypothetical protein" protein_id=Seg9358.2/GoldUCD/D3Y31
MGELGNRNISRTHSLFVDDLKVYQESHKLLKKINEVIVQARMQTVDPDQEEIYKFLGVEQTNGIKTKKVYQRVKEEVKKRLKLPTKSELNDENLIQAINSKVIPVAAYPMNVCQMTKGELNELDQIVKRELRMKKMLGRQASDERLYL